MKNRTDKNEQRIEQLESELIGFRSAVEELKVLNEIAVSAGKASDMDQTLNIIVQKIIKSVEAEQGLIYLVTPQKDVFKTFIKQDDTSTLKHSYQISTNITGWVLLNEKPLLIENLSKDKRFNSTEEEKRAIRSVLCSPIWFEGKIIGIILMINKRDKKSPDLMSGRFSENELTLLSIIAVQAGQIIKNSQMQREAMIKMKEAEIAELKSRFFTNISHEFRTPLTLILGPAEKLLAESQSDDTLKQAGLIKRNAIRLLGLINQLLDLSKLEAGKLKLEASLSNIVSFVKGVTQSFESLAEQKDIELKVVAEKENVELYFDKDKMLKILSNLLSNALKFTPEDGTIIVSINLPTPKSPPVEGTFKSELSPPLEGRLVSAKHQAEVGGVGQKLVGNNKVVTISVRDTGIGIPEEELPKLFERFYQVETSQVKKYGGTGIGLALTKELVELHRGFIKVSSKPGEGSEFTIELPPGKDHLNEDEIIEEGVILNPDEVGRKNLPELIMDDEFKIDSLSQVPQDDIEFTEDKTIILVVEDNADVRDFIKDALGKDFEIAEAANGEQGIRKAEKLIPDLIISDIAMPVMNGIELTRRLKSDEKTSHIPVILLTAKSEQESKIEGLETGADDYLTKPFDSKELRIRIKNLIYIRRKLQEKFGKTDFVSQKRSEAKTDKLTNLEEKFISKVLEIIEKHLSEEEFSIEQFGKEVGMSRVQLHRKLKVLTGKSASNYLRSVRLSKAKKMIEEQKGNVSEIAYSVGFSSPQYFTHCFKEEFGYPPSELIK
jgi:signal transduction histidine kinase/DNA-binding response OmpR family regulator